MTPKPLTDPIRGARRPAPPALASGAGRFSLACLLLVVVSSVAGAQLVLESAGFELGVAFPLAGGAFEPHLSAAYNRFDTELAIDARYFGLIERTVQTSSGSTYSLTGGLSWVEGEKVLVTGEVFYTPLDIGPTFGAPRASRDLVNVRALLLYRLR